VNELCFKPVRGMILVVAGCEMRLELLWRRATMPVLARGFGKEVAVGKGESAFGDGRCTDPRVGGRCLGHCFVDIDDCSVGKIKIDEGD